MFQFTHPVRGATVIDEIESLQHKFQFTHPVRGATDANLTTKQYVEFQFTHPVRGATRLARELVRKLSVSIHAPRAGCDLNLVQMSSGNVCFNSRTPCGVRLQHRYIVEFYLKFQFTHPVRGATT